MKKLYLSIFMAGISGALALGATLSPEEALSRALDTSPLRSVGTAKGSMTLKFTESLNDTPALYIFSGRDGNGYAVVAADDATTPLLGYSYVGYLPERREDLPEAMIYWLETLSQEVEMNSTGNVVAIGAPQKVTRASIAPLCSTRWNQGSPYNNLAPTVNGTRCYTGCVATGMAQVLKYYNYPEKGTGTHSYEWTPSGGSTQELSFNFENTTFDWTNMTDTYTSTSTAVENNAVATLMKACGVSVDMNYGTGASGAVSKNIGSALIDYFGYDKGLKYLSREYYTIEEWEDLIYNNLVEFGPLPYSGRNSSSGHLFVCDGYADGYFHFNWGWGGLSDGYYLLTALNPGQQGIGGSTSGYNMDQGVITNISHGGISNGYWEQLDWRGSLEISKESAQLGSSVDVSGTIINNCYTAISDTKAGFEYVPADGGDPVVYLYRNVNLEPGYYYSSTSTTTRIPSDLTDGVYLMYPVFQDSKGNIVKMRVSSSYAGYATVRVEGDTAYFTNAEPASISVSDFALDSYLYMSTPFKVTATLSNPSSREYYGNLVAGISVDGVLKAWGNDFTIDLEGNSSIDWEYISSLTYGRSDFTIAAGDYQLGIYAHDSDAGTYTLVSDLIDVTLHAKTTPSISVSNFSVPDNQNPANLKATATLKCTSGYFAGNLTCYIFPGNGGTSIASFSSEFISVAAPGSSYNIMKAPAIGETTVEFNMPFSAGESFTTYLAGLYYNGTRLTNSISFTTGELTTGLTDTFQDPGAVRTEYFTLTGVCVGTEKPAPGLYIVRDYFEDGSATSSKRFIR